MEIFYFNDEDVIECGIDEAGRGPLIGNVYAAAVIWPKDLKPDEKLIVDSKKLSIKKRKLAFEWIIKNISTYGIGFATNNEIDNINILEATKLAMERAIINLNNKINYNITHYIIDGTGWEKKFIHLKNVKSIVKGDSKYYSIAAASILAKEHHDLHIEKLCQDNNELDIKYNILKNMGYGTKKHIDGIKEHGYSTYHRSSFNIKSL
jgi:ribonuclease HII